MNLLASELNEQLKANNHHIHDMLSTLGRELFFPRGILSQSAEAKEKAHRFNATIGIALEGGTPMHLPCIQSLLGGLDPKDLYPYAPAAGIPALRDKWQRKQLQENPRMRDKRVGRPIVTSALTHGLALVGDLFVDPGDTLVLPDKFWGNYRLIYEIRRDARLVTYPLYDGVGGFHKEAFRQTLKEAAVGGKVIVLLNFPNNPCGYSITPAEADSIVTSLVEVADQGSNLIVILDEAYFGLFYEDHLLKESLFGYLANRHERILAIKLDGATKEEFVWGFRVGFLCYGAGNLGKPDEIHSALEKKTMGAIRGYISNSSHLAQTLVLRALESPEFDKERGEKITILKARALKVREALRNPDYGAAWSVYPFNSGYFMCVKLKHVDAERLRLHLLDRYGIGVIAAGTHDIRVAFSCVEESDIPELFESMYRAVQELTG